MSEHYKFVPEHQLYFLTGTVVGWIDIFTRDEYVQILLDSWTWYTKNRGLKIHAYVIMSNHFHMIASCDSEPLSKVIRAFKSYSAKRVFNSIRENPQESRKKWILNLLELNGRDIEQNFKLWKSGSHFLSLYNSSRIQKAIEYVHLNPVKAGIVEKPEYYRNSSAGFYYLDHDPQIPISSLHRFNLLSG